MTPANPLTVFNDVDFKTKKIRIRKSVAKTKAKGQYRKSPKTKAGNRDIILSDVAMESLRKWKEEAYAYAVSLGDAWCGEPLKHFNDNAVFIKKEVNPGTRMSVDLPTSKFKEILTMYNNQCENEDDLLPMIRLHDLRHTHASILLANNVDIGTVSHRLGHEKITTTLSIYAHFIPDRDFTAADTFNQIWSK